MENDAVRGGSGLYTPGPWVAAEDDGTITGLVFAKDGRPIIGGGGHVVYKADARLIAAAPTMLAVCQAVAAFRHLVEHEEVAEAIDAARAALEKADPFGHDDSPTPSSVVPESPTRIEQADAAWKKVDRYLKPTVRVALRKAVAASIHAASSISGGGVE